MSLGSKNMPGKAGVLDTGTPPEYLSEVLNNEREQGFKKMHETPFLKEGMSVLYKNAKGEERTGSFVRFLSETGHVQLQDISGVRYAVHPRNILQVGEEDTVLFSPQRTEGSETSMVEKLKRGIVDFVTQLGLENEKKNEKEGNIFLFDLSKRAREAILALSIFTPISAGANGMNPFDGMDFDHFGGHTSVSASKSSVQKNMNGGGKNLKYGAGRTNFRGTLPENKKTNVKTSSGNFVNSGQNNWSISYDPAKNSEVSYWKSNQDEGAYYNQSWGIDQLRYGKGDIEECRAKFFKLFCKVFGSAAPGFAVDASAVIAMKLISDVANHGNHGNNNSTESGGNNAAAPGAGPGPGAAPSAPSIPPGPGAAPGAPLGGPGPGL